MTTALASQSPVYPPTHEPEAADERQLLRRLAGCLAHHVNNALTGVIGHVELAQRGISPRHPVAEHLRESLACAFQAAEAVKRIVAFACRPEVPRLDRRLALAAVAEQAAEQLRASHRPGLTVRVVRDSAGWVLSSAVLVRTALEQVLANAVEAMPSGGTLVLRVHQRDEQCCLTVSDTGGGVAAEMLPHLCEPFRTTKQAGHLGLGLAQARELMQLLGGQLDLASVSGQGTAVTLALPSVEAVEAEPRRAPEVVPSTLTVDAYGPAYVSV